MLDTVDLSLRLERSEYRERLAQLRRDLRRHAKRLYDTNRALIAVFEGWDASGKGGAIRRLTGPIDPRGVKVSSIAAPTEDEARHHYLWRFWTRLRPPEERQIQIFDRSWYGRVLVERVEGFAEEDEWRRAYREINQFERELVDGGFLLVKFWIHLSKDEQKRRFDARRITPHKQWKLTDEDWRNRQRWDDYSEAVDDMLQRTSTLSAPWIVVEGEDKLWARIKVLDTVHRCLAEAEDS